MVAKRIEWEFDYHALMEDIREKKPQAGGLRDLETESVSHTTLSRIVKGKEPSMRVFLGICQDYDLQPGDYFKRNIWVRMDGNG